MTLTLAYSPCPNDCFILTLWYTKIDTEGLEFEVQLGDVETPTGRPFQRAPTLPNSAFMHTLTRWITTSCCAGSALGFNCGPLLIKSNNRAIEQKSIRMACSHSR